MFHVSIVSKLSRIPVFHSETEPENDFTQMKKGFALRKEAQKTEEAEGKL